MSEQLVITDIDGDVVSITGYSAEGRLVLVAVGGDGAGRAFGEIRLDESNARKLRDWLTNLLDKSGPADIPITE